MIKKLIYTLFSTILIGCSNQCGLYFDENAEDLCLRWANHLDSLVFENNDKSIQDTLLVDYFYWRQPDINISENENQSRINRENAKIKYRLIHNNYAYAIIVELIADTTGTSVNLTVDNVAYSPKNGTALPALLFERLDTISGKNTDKPSVETIEVGPDKHGYMSGILSITINGVKLIHDRE